MDISVVVPVHNRKRDLRACVEHLLVQDIHIEYEIILCDDGSTENIQSFIEGTWPSEKKIRYYRQLRKGPAAARNLGIRHARSEIIAITDSDTLPQPAWLRKLWETFQQNPNAVGVEGKVITSETPSSILEVGPTNLSGGVYLTCNIAYRRDALFKAGGFDESFPYPAYEDVDLAAVIMKMGPIIWQPEAVVIHLKRRETLLTTLKELQYWKYILLMGYRYGYLAWKRYPVKYPRLKIVYLATVALPVSKLVKAIKGFPQSPKRAIELAWIGIVEGIAAFFLIVPRVLFGWVDLKNERKRYL